MAQQHHALLLIILDGWGHRECSEYNPIVTAKTPFIDSLFKKYPNTLLHASGTSVGLPPGQMGNSEVGHLHIGAGRKILQDLSRINKAIEDGSFQNNALLEQMLETAKQKGSRIHILGLLSPGGVHSHEKHIQALVNLISDHGIECYCVHAILDGRDVPPKSAATSLKMLKAPIASIVGRYYAMDRNQCWERTQQAYELFTQGRALYQATTALQALAEAYERGETDEFVKPTVITPLNENPMIIKDDDLVVFMNFRADRARQLSYALTNKNFNHFPRFSPPKLKQFLTLTEYSQDLNAKVIFKPLPLNNVLGEYLATKGLRQLRIAETEKYAHITYFINGGRELPFPQEDRLLIPSPKVSTYDLQPEMSANEITNKLVEAIWQRHYDVIICNYANPDMIGHTGINAAAEQAVRVIDHCLQRVIEAVQAVDGEALITADHGNIEIIYDKRNKQPHTAHTNNLVPLIYVGRPAVFQKEYGGLDDVAPTLLSLLGLDKPPEMTGHSLLTFKSKNSAAKNQLRNLE